MVHQPDPTLAYLAGALGVTFTEPALLRLALVHTSYANEHKSGGDHNQRLEFLGDAVLDLVVSDLLYRAYPDLPEGELTKARAAVVCEATLARRARELGLGDHLLLGRGEAATGGRERASILADAFEAVLGAVYLDSGLTAAVAFVRAQLGPDLDQVAGGNYGRDHKTLLQELVQRSDGKIAYEVIDASGPDHSKTFTVAVAVNDARLGTGAGRTKKEAEQAAARQAVAKLNASENDL